MHIYRTVLVEKHGKYGFSGSTYSFKKINLNGLIAVLRIIYLFWLCWVSPLLPGVFSSCSSGGYSSCTSGFSCCGHGSGLHGFGGYGSRLSGWVQGSSKHRPSSAWASLLRGMWDLPISGIQPVSPPFGRQFLPVGYQEPWVPSLEDLH